MQTRLRSLLLCCLWIGIGLLWLQVGMAGLVLSWQLDALLPVTASGLSIVAGAAIVFGGFCGLARILYYRSLPPHVRAAYPEPAPLPTLLTLELMRQVGKQIHALRRKTPAHRRKTPRPPPSRS